MQIELKLDACKHCGSEARLWTGECAFGVAHVYIACTGCQIQTEEIDINRSRSAEAAIAKVAEAWNRRAGSDAKSGDVLRWAAQIVQLYDDATMNDDDYMIDIGDAERILKALADYVDQFAAPAPAPESEQTSDDASVTLRDDGPARKPWFGPLVKQLAQADQPERGELPRIDDGMFNLATEAWSRATDAAWDSDGLAAVIRALTVPAPIDEEAANWLDEAADDIADWGAYASAYFQEKHDLAGDVKRYRERAASIRAALATAGGDGSTQLVNAIRRALRDWYSADEILRQALAQYEQKEPKT